MVFSLPCVTVLSQFIEWYFNVIFTFILALHVFENIFETSLKNTQNKDYYYLSVVCNNSLFLIRFSSQIIQILSIKCLVFTVLARVP